MNADNQTLIQPITNWLVVHGLKIVAIIVVVWFVQYFADKFIERIVRRIIKRNPKDSMEDERKREDTIIEILHGTLMVVLWVVAAMMILSEVGVEIAPLLAAAGVLGLALGFGGQYLIKDVIAGFFMIVENQFRVGDVVCIDGTCGLVEDITLRLTTLRDLDGVVHHIPNGSAAVISNMTKDLSRVNLNIGIAYDTELEKAIKVINDVGETMAKDEEWAADIIDPPKFLRVDDFADSAVVVKILGETLPSRQWDVTGELRIRLKVAFDKHGIEIPFPQRVMHKPKD